MARAISASSMEKIHGAIAVQRADGDHRMLGVEPGDLLDGQGADVLFDSGRYSPPIMNARLPEAPTLPAINSELVITVRWLWRASSRANSRVVVPVSMKMLSPGPNRPAA